MVKHLDPIFATLAPGIGDIAAHARAREGRRHRRAGLPALRPERRRPLRQDGAQRHRVRPHGRLRRGLGVLRAANVGKQTARDRRRDDAAARSGALSVRPQPARHRRGVAARQRDRLVAARPDGGRAGRRIPALAKFAGRVSDSGEGRWTIKAAIDEAVPAPVLTDRALRALQLARRGGLPGQAALGHALSSSAGTWKNRPEQ